MFGNVQDGTLWPLIGLARANVIGVSNIAKCLDKDAFVPQRLGGDDFVNGEKSPAPPSHLSRPHYSQYTRWRVSLRNLLSL